MKGASIYAARVNAFRRLLLEHALRAHGGNRSAAARALGLGRRHFLRLIRQHGIAEAVPLRRTA